MTTETSTECASPPQAVRASPVSWGGIIETLYTDCLESENLPKKIKILKEKLACLEGSKTLEDIQHALHFTKMERNYLNSPLLDEIFDTIFFSNDLFLTCCNSGKLHALKFYMTRLDFKNKSAGFIDAANKGHINIVKYLLKFNIDYDVRCYVLAIACKNGSKELVEFMLKHANIFKCSGFINACAKGRLEVAEFLLDNFYRCRLDDIEDAFLEAVENDQEKIVVLLMRFGAGNKTLKRAFISACENGNEEIIDILLGKKPGFNDVDEKLAKLAEDGNLMHEQVNFCKTRTKPSNYIISCGMDKCEHENRHTLYGYLENELTPN